MLAAAGDALAFERLYRRHLARIHSLARRMVGDDLANELTQDIFVRVWEKLGTYRGEAAFGTWLYRVGVNVILGRRKQLGIRRERYVTGDEVIEQLSTDSGGWAGGRAGGRAGDRETAVDFEAAIQHLPAGARAVFILHDVEGYKHREIAGLLEITEGTSKSQLHRARMILRDHLDR